VVVDEGEVNDTRSCLRVGGKPSEFSWCVGEVIAVSSSTVEVP